MEAALDISLAFGLVPTVKDIKGHSPLHYAVSGSSLEILNETTDQGLFFHHTPPRQFRLLAPY